MFLSDKSTGDMHKKTINLPVSKHLDISECVSGVCFSIQFYILLCSSLILINKKKAVFRSARVSSLAKDEDTEQIFVTKTPHRFFLCV